MISFCIKLLIIITSPKVTCSRRDLADKLLTGRFTSFQSLTDLTNFNRSLKQFHSLTHLSNFNHSLKQFHSLTHLTNFNHPLT